MNDHECTHEFDIARLIQWVDGNGKPGLREDVIGMKTQLKTIETSLGDLATNVSTLVKFQVEVKTKDKIIFNAWQRVSIIIAAIGGLSAIVIKIINLIGR